MKVKNHAEVSPYTQYINTSEPLMTSPISAFLSSYISDDALVTGKLIISTYFNIIYLYLINITHHHIICMLLHNNYVS